MWKRLALFVLHGTWWVQDAARAVKGTLRLDGEYWRLDTVGRLQVDGPWRDELSFLPPSVIYGAALGTRYTLQDAYLRQDREPAVYSYAAELLGTGPRFPRRLVAERRIRFVHVGRHVRIPESALIEYVIANTVEPTMRPARPGRVA
jgi:excisionase family DNA binding protein